jgi:hypothetical protein
MDYRNNRMDFGKYKKVKSKTFLKMDLLFGKMFGFIKFWRTHV